MKSFLIATVIAAACIAIPARAADVGVSLSIGQPGFYGRIEIGDYYPQPQVIYRQPRIILRGERLDRPPIYLRVPPGHVKNWKRDCRKYNACGERVFFVRDDWYEREYVPHYQEKHRDRRDDRHDGSKKNDRGHGKKDKDHGRDR